MKKYLYKVYRANGTYITNWSDATFYGFKMQLNSGMGECIIKLARKFDDFGEDGDVKHNNRVDITVIDQDTSPEGLVIYSGYISGYSPYIDGYTEGISITLLGYISKLATAILKNGSTVSITYSNTDPSQMVKNIIDRYRAECTNPKINYTAATIEMTGQSNTYTFKLLTYADALTKCVELAPANYWWFVGADNVFYFQPKANLATHRFVFNKHFKKIEVFKNMEKVVNRVLFTNGLTGANAILKLYSDTDSSDDYDDRWEILNDSNIIDETTANNKGNAYLSKYKNADITTEVEIIDNNESTAGYDIESIKPGDTCSFLGLNEITSKTFSGVLLIKSVSYTPDKASIEVESLQESIARSQNNLSKQLQEEIIADAPTTYPTVP